MMKISDYYKPVETREQKLLRLLRDGYWLCVYKESQAGAMSISLVSPISFPALGARMVKVVG